MAQSRAAALRRLWLNVHLWIGVGLALLLIPISISGGLLVVGDQIDALVNPQRYAVTGMEATQPPSVYLARATEAVAANNLRPTALRYPERAGDPVRVLTRAQQRTEGPPRAFTVFLDPPTARVLDVMDFRASFVGLVHIFHENLLLQQHNGRQIVGWAGVGMLILSLTGIWLWWPRNGGFFKGLRWTRSPRFTFNLHNMLGFWISIPLALVSATGIYLSFPQSARTLMASVAPMSAQGPRGFFGDVAQHMRLTADRALEIARQTEPSAKPQAVFLPIEARGGPGAGLAWRVQLARVDGEAVTVSIDDHTGTAATATAPQSGDRAALWIRWIHEGSHSGAVWKAIVFLTGIFPTIFAVTGVIMWLRKRADRKASAARTQPAARPQLHPAE